MAFLSVIADSLNSKYIFIAPPLFIVLALISLLVKYTLASLRPRNFPPGPPIVPLLGNVPQLPSSKLFLKFTEWSKEYGSIIGLKLGPQNVVILNNYRHVKELFDKKGAIYSSRPDNYIGNQLLCPDDTHILLLPYGQSWRTQRKVVQSLLNITAVDNLLPIQNAEASQTMHQLLQDPAGYYQHIRRYSTAVILASVFGQRGASFDSPKVQALYHVQEQFTQILEQGATPPVDAFPFLTYLPEFLSPWRTKAREIRKKQHDLYFALLRETRERVGKGGVPCFMEKVLEEQEKLGFDDEHVAYLGGILMEAGSDTTSSTILCFILGLLKYPEILKKAQAEVDQVCGTSRSPSPEDINDLPYIRACMTETLRWRPIAAGGIPHMLTQDDVYEGYLIPKGTMLFANTWAIHRDEEEYESPDAFIPERYLNNKFGTRSIVQDGSDDHRRVTYGFGAGRRVCPGQRLGENSLMINMAKLVWGFDITPGHGGPVDADIGTAFTDGFLTGPKEFPVKFTPRSDRHRKIIEGDYEAAQSIFKQYEE